MSAFLGMTKYAIRAALDQSKRELDQTRRYYAAAQASLQQRQAALSAYYNAQLEGDLAGRLGVSQEQAQQYLAQYRANPAAFTEIKRDYSALDAAQRQAVAKKAGDVAVQVLGKQAFGNNKAANYATFKAALQSALTADAGLRGVNFDGNAAEELTRAALRDQLKGVASGSLQGFAQQGFNPIAAVRANLVRNTCKIRHFDFTDAEIQAVIDDIIAGD